MYESDVRYILDVIREKIEIIKNLLKDIALILGTDLDTSKETLYSVLLQTEEYLNKVNEYDFLCDKMRGWLNQVSAYAPVDESYYNEIYTLEYMLDDAKDALGDFYNEVSDLYNKKAAKEYEEWDWDY